MILVNAGLSPAVPKFLQNVSACALAWETYEADLSVKLEMVSPEGDYATNTMGKGSIRQLEAGFASIPVSDGQHGSETAAQVIGGACSTTPNCVYGAFITSAVPCCSTRGHGSTQSWCTLATAVTMCMPARLREECVCAGSSCSICFHNEGNEATDRASKLVVFLHSLSGLQCFLTRYAFKGVELLS
jgi:hypothetical protein